MNLTLLPTDLNITNQGQPVLNKSVTDNPSSQFEQLLNAETAAMRKPSAQTDKNNLKGEKSASDKAFDKTTEKSQSPVTTESDHRVVKDKSQAEEAVQQENRAEFAVLKEDDLLSAEALSAAIPIQLAGLLPPQANSAVVPENANGRVGDESLENTLSENAGLDSKNSPVSTQLDNNIKDSRLIDPRLAERAKAGEQHEDVQFVAKHAKQETPLTNKNEAATNLQSELAPLAGQIKLAASRLATQNKAGSDSTVLKNAVSAISDNISGNSKEPNLFQTAIQAAPALATATAETAPVDSPALLATPSLLSAGQPPAGQFQLHSTTAPLLNAHLGSEEWQQQLNQHVLFFNRHGLQQAELRLHPQELGALHIRMSVEDNQAQLHFVSAHQHVRAALEAALPGLRHALAENGIQLAQSSVNSDPQGNPQQQHFANNPNNHSRSHAETQGHDSTAATEMTVSHPSAIRVTPQQLTSARGGVDTFA
ncbi:flagellar hook-length control protein FliK [Xenorhabdus doucetiae]|uniref:Flagellar hook-length control protein FliK n=1 Tax=Xenorhabdus doucetiae TaxID=351671 RepID=A0A068QT84_9GAMM|nr:flagellar hook-length control protein FliK [Xenorhabdus doucetiae]TYP15955.1 flagellar hook-length control protein FliK [Xenorhabdus doucetiae]CDG18014.1 Flagellar hook-length control protein FliK [Xenorhabdus doucetiae]